MDPALGAQLGARVRARAGQGVRRAVSARSNVVRSRIVLEPNLSSMTYAAPPPTSQAGTLSSAEQSPGVERATVRSQRPGPRGWATRARATTTVRRQETHRRQPRAARGSASSAKRTTSAPPSARTAATCRSSSKPSPRVSSASAIAIVPKTTPAASTSTRSGQAVSSVWRRRIARPESVRETSAFQAARATPTAPILRPIAMVTPAAGPSPATTSGCARTTRRVSIRAAGAAAAPRTLIAKESA